MKILQVCAYAAPYEGNFIATLKHLDAKLKAAGHQIIYAFPENARSLPWCIELSQCASVYFLPLAKARFRPVTYCEIKKIFTENPDITIAHSHFELYDMPMLAVAPKTVKMFWHLHDAIHLSHNFSSRLLQKLQYRWFHGDAQLLAVSRKLLEYVTNLGFPNEQAKYIPNGIDTDRIRLVTIPKDTRKFDFLILGWQAYRKGVDLCIEATRKLSKNIKVGIVCNPSSLENASLLPLPEGVEMVTPVTDINQLYEQTRCFLHISRAEGLSYALLEAVYAGLPIICSDIEENSFASIFPTVKMVASGNVDSIAEAMEYQLISSSISIDQINIARKLILEEYSIQHWVDEILKEYKL